MSKTKGKNSTNQLQLISQQTLKIQVLPQENVIKLINQTTTPLKIQKGFVIKINGIHHVKFQHKVCFKEQLIIQIASQNKLSIKNEYENENEIKYIYFAYNHANLIKQPMTISFQNNNNITIARYIFKKNIKKNENNEKLNHRQSQKRPQHFFLSNQQKIQFKFFFFFFCFYASSKIFLIDTYTEKWMMMNKKYSVICLYYWICQKKNLKNQTRRIIQIGGIIKKFININWLCINKQQVC